MTEKQLDVGTWGIFFVWIGAALLASLPWGVWLVGTGAIVVGAQIARHYIGSPVEIFWLVVGALFVLGGVSELAELDRHFAIIPIVCITAGAGLIASALRASRRQTSGT